MLPTSVAIVSAAFPAERARSRARDAGRRRRGGRRARADARRRADLGAELARRPARQRAARGDLHLPSRSAPSPADAPRRDPARVDLAGAVLLCIALIGLVFGFTETQGDPWSPPAVLLPLIVAVARRRAVRDPRAESPTRRYEPRPAAPEAQLPGRHDQPGIGRRGRDRARRDLPAAADPQPGDDARGGRARADPDHAADDRRQPARGPLVRPLRRPATADDRLTCSSPSRAWRSRWARRRERYLASSPGCWSTASRSRWS